MNMTELVEKVAENCELPNVALKSVKHVIEEALAEIVAQLQKGEKVNLRNFGSFVVVTSGPRKTRNPRTGETLMVESRKRVKFKPSSSMKGLISE